MSEESNVVISPAKTEGDLKNENQHMEVPSTKPALHAEEPPYVKNESAHITEEKSNPLNLTFEINVEPADLSLEQKMTPSDTPTETKSLESDTDESAKKTPSFSEISQSVVTSSDKTVEKVTEDIQLLNKGLKDMKLSGQEVAASPSSKKGRKNPSTPRARSTPVITSPPLTRSRSRDLRKFPSTPSSPGKLSGRKGSESDSDEIRVRGRERVKKN